jgi:hypothetical protein
MLPLCSTAECPVNWALVVACLALVFTVTSFWWLQARRGSLEVGQPGAYTFATRVRLKLPLAIYNAGARALVVTDLLVLVDDGDVRLPWIATTDRLYGDEGRDFQTAFAVGVTPVVRSGACESSMRPRRWASKDGHDEAHEAHLRAGHPQVARCRPDAGRAEVDR